MGTFRALQNAAFDSFDPSLANTFDPGMNAKYNNANGNGGAASQINQAQPGQKMQFNVTMNNPSAQNLWFELFCYVDSYIDRLKTEYQVGNYLYIPLASLEGLTAHAGTHGGVIGFDKDGNLVIQGDPSIPELSGTLSCGQISYQGLFRASGITPFQVSYIRMTCNSDEQIDQDLTYFTRSYSGGITQNPITPRSYFQPTQFQNFTIDLPIEAGIEIQSGFKVKVLAGENLRYAIFVTNWSSQVTS